MLQGQQLCVSEILISPKQFQHFGSWDFPQQDQLGEACTQDPSQPQSGMNSPVPKGGILSRESCAKAPKLPLDNCLGCETLECCGENISACFQPQDSVPILLYLDYATQNCHVKVTTEATVRAVMCVHFLD